MGTPQLAASVLEILLSAGQDHARVVAVVTRPDEPRGRGLKLHPSEVALVAERYRIPVLKPTRIRTAEFLAELSSFTPDVLVIAGYGRILPDAVLAAARLMPINVHTSLLPKFRGASPVEGATGWQRCGSRRVSLRPLPSADTLRYGLWRTAPMASGSLPAPRTTQ